MVLRVCISAGHGPETPGKRSPDGVKEFAFNYPTAELLANYLLTFKDVQVLKVYAQDRDVPLAERTKRANEWDADLYMSIHYNAYGSSFNSAEGIETLVYSTSTSATSGYPVGKEIHKELLKLAKRVDRGVKTRPDLWELRMTNMRAVLCECGFMTNKQERDLMKDQAYQEVCARGIGNGIANFYGLKKKEDNVTPKPKPTEPVKLYRVQIGAYAKLSNAVRQVNRVKKDGYDAWINSDDGLHRVQTGAFKDHQNAEKLVKELRDKGYQDAWIFE